MLKNSFKNALHKKAQLFGLAVLVALLALVLALLTSMNARVLRSNDDLKRSSNLHNIVLQMDPFDNVPTGESDDDAIPNNRIAAQQYWIDQLQNAYVNENSPLQFNWSRTEARQFSQLFDGEYNLTIKVLAKTTLENNTNKEAIDKLVIFSGHDIQTDHDIVVDSVFAQKHSLKIGNIVRIQKDIWGDQVLVSSPLNEESSSHPDFPTFLKDIETIEKEGINKENGLYQQKYAKNYDWYQIVGFGGSADFSMPVLDANSPIPNRDKEALFYVHPKAFSLELKDFQGKLLYNFDNSSSRLRVSSNTEWESFYSLKTTNGRNLLAKQIDEMNSRFNTLLGRTTNSQQRQYFYALGDSNYRFSSRTDSLSKVIKGYNLSVSILVILLAVVVFYSLGLIIRKQIDNARGQIGVLKSLGYNNGIIMFNFVMTPFFASFIGGIIGFAIGGGVSTVLVNEFMNYFTLNYGQAYFSWPWFLLTIFGLWFVLTGIAFLITAIVLRKSAIDLVQGKRTTKISRQNLRFKERFKDRPTGQKIRVALFLDAKGKMSVVGWVVLLSTIMFTISFAAPNLLRHNTKMTFAGVNYEQVVEYNEPVYNNPLTFYKTFNDSAPEAPFNETFKYSPTKKAFSALPLLKNTDGTYGKYDLEKIVNDYLNNQMNSHYYSLSLAKSAGDVPIPDLINANMKFLSGQNIASSTEYYKFMGKYGEGGIPFLVKILLEQWPDYVELTGNLGKTDSTLVQNFNTLQGFYSKVVNSIGLSITNNFYDTSGDAWWDQSDDWKINSFNNGGPNGTPAQNIDAVWQKVMNDQSNNWNSTLLSTSKPDDFALTTSDYGVGDFRIMPPTIDENGNEIIVVPPSKYLEDYYLTLNGQDLFTNHRNQFDQVLAKFITWFGALFSNRGDQAIIQAAYFRPPYFVQQFLKEAYEKEETYNQSFGVVSYNPALEQYGTLMHVRDSQGRVSKIYGTLRQNPYINLYDKKNNNLLEKLYQNNNPQGIIINKSMAKRLRLRVGQSVPLTVLQKELRSKNGEIENSIKLDDWDLGNQRNWNDDDGNFTQITNLDNKSAGLNVNGQKLNVAPGLLSTNKPSKYYQAVLDDKLINETLETNLNFEVVGIHEGYGDSQAWIKEDTAKKILKFNAMDDYNWQKFFSWQWGKTFTQNLGEINGIQFTGLTDLDLSTGEIDYQIFINNYLNNSNARISSQARIVNQIFHNAFPIFNYKYSNKKDVGDLRTLVSTWQEYGDYSPIGLQGITANGTSITQSFDGMGQGSMSNINPTSTAKAILAQISDLVMLVIILVIIAILLITFVIILLTTSLIIDDNSRFIATLKVLGYSNSYIAKTVLGMYFVLIAIVYLVGFIAGWFIFTAIVNALISSVVLPLYFPIWLPFAVAAGVIGVYAITIAVGFRSISKTNPISLLQSNAF